MNRTDLASVLFGVSGLFMAVTRLPELVIYAGVVAGGVEWAGEPAVMYAGIAGSTLSVLIGIGLTVFRSQIATALFIETRPVESISPASDLQAVGFSIVGLYFLIQGIGRSASTWGTTDYQSYILVVLGIAVFLGASTLSRIWQRLRTAGR